MCGNANWMMAVYLNPAETGLNINCWVFGSQVRVGVIWQNILCLWTLWPIDLSYFMTLFCCQC